MKKVDTINKKSNTIHPYTSLLIIGFLLIISFVLGFYFKGKRIKQIEIYDFNSGYQKGLKDAKSSSNYLAGLQYVYPTVNLTDEAKLKVEQYANDENITQRESATKMVLDFSTSTVVTIDPPITTETVSTTTITKTITTVGETGNDFYVAWAPSHINSRTVHIQIVRKIGDNPIKYEFIRRLASSTPNDGYLKWTPKPTDTGELFIQLACGTVPPEECFELPIIPINKII